MLSSRCVRDQGRVPDGGAGPGGGYRVRGKHEYGLDRVRLAVVMVGRYRVADFRRLGVALEKEPAIFAARMKVFAHQHTENQPFCDGFHSDL